MNKSFWVWLGEKFGFVNLIKIEGKGFDDLTNEEVSYMIEAFIEGGNDFFDPMALGDFMNYDLKNENLINVRAKIAKGIFIKDYSDIKRYDFEFLRRVAEELKRA
ncbi:hypothetical protein Q668_17350 [Alcanivorax sp. PN-3]|nr:hypothetical protein Q668_17350 [Alcanivorax sp. PN-3]